MLFSKNLLAVDNLNYVPMTSVVNKVTLQFKMTLAGALLAGQRLHLASFLVFGICGHL